LKDRCGTGYGIEIPGSERSASKAVSLLSAKGDAMTLILPALLICIGGTTTADEEKKLPEQTAKAIALVDALAKGDYSAAGKNFDRVMEKAFPADERKHSWEMLVKQVGEYQKRTGVRVEKAGKYDVVIVTCQFKKMALDARVVFNAEKQVAGLNFLPAKGAYDFKPPPYAQPESFGEAKVVVGSGEWALPGTLTLPKGDGPFPAAVLVHGSGPHDRDETIGPNKPFRDLAWGLASQGIAVLRYEKRTHAHAPRMPALKDTFTLKEETIDDALAAVAELRKHKEIDAKRIIVIGHSLGAMVAPQIAARDQKIAGIVLLAGNSRPLEDVVLDQITYIKSLNGKLTDADREEVDELKKKIARVKDPKLSADTPAKELPLGAPAVYWMALRAYNQTATASRLTLPMLIAQGERDYQVTMDDFNLWEKALATHRNVTFRRYPKLNHLFMEGKGKAKPEEYSKAGHMARELVDDLAAWIKKL
jgi:dienelactone hydrolase